MRTNNSYKKDNTIWSLWPVLTKWSSGREASDVYFLQLVRSRCHLPGSSVGGQADLVISRSILDLQTEPLVDLVKLQSDVVKEYFTGKPSIQCFEPQQFRFRDSLPSSHTLKTKYDNNNMITCCIYTYITVSLLFLALLGQVLIWVRSPWNCHTSSRLRLLLIGVASLTNH